MGRRQKKQSRKQKAKKREKYEQRNQDKEEKNNNTNNNWNNNNENSSNNNSKRNRRRQKRKNKRNRQNDEIDEKFKKHLESLGYFIREVRGDGNCLFRSVSEQMEGNENNYKEYREKCINYTSLFTMPSTPCPPSGPHAIIFVPNSA